MLRDIYRAGRKRKFNDINGTSSVPPQMFGGQPRSYITIAREESQSTKDGSSQQSNPTSDLKIQLDTESRKVLEFFKKKNLHHEQCSTTTQEIFSKSNQQKNPLALPGFSESKKHHEEKNSTGNLSAKLPGIKEFPLHSGEKTSNPFADQFAKTNESENPKPIPNPFTSQAEPLAPFNAKFNPFQNITGGSSNNPFNKNNLAPTNFESKNNPFLAPGQVPIFNFNFNFTAPPEGIDNEEEDNKFNPEEEVKIESGHCSLPESKVDNKSLTKKYIEVQIESFALYDYKEKKYVNRGNGLISLESYVSEKNNQTKGILVFRNDGGLKVLFQGSILCGSSSIEKGTKPGKFLLFLSQVITSKDGKIENNSIRIKCSNVNIFNKFFEKFNSFCDLLKSGKEIPAESTPQESIPQKEEYKNEKKIEEKKEEPKAQEIKKEVKIEETEKSKPAIVNPFLPSNPFAQNKSLSVISEPVSIQPTLFSGFVSSTMVNKKTEESSGSSLFTQKFSAFQGESEGPQKKITKLNLKKRFKGN